MLAHVLDLARRRGAAADALLRDQATLTLRFESGRLKATALAQEAGLNLRVFADGRFGIAGSTDLSSPDDVVARAFASCAEGERLEAALPRAGIVPVVETFDERAAGLNVADLAAIGRAVVEQLQRPGWQVNASVDRVVETSTIANTAGQSVSWRSSGVIVSAEVTRVSGDDVLMAYDTAAGAGVPDSAELDAVARTIVTKIERSATIVEAPDGRLPVLFTPEGLGAVLLPVRQALSGKSVVQGISPLGDRVGQTCFDTAFTLTDDPLLDGRLASRPADDEGVPSARTMLVEHGTLRGFIYDLETAARASTVSTGHGHRTTFGKPGISFSNLLLAPGTLDEAALLREVGRGLVVDELIGVGQGNVVSGAFSHPVALAWRVEGGEITGRVKDAAIAGNAFELLQRIRAVGSEAKWLGGSRLVPPMVLDGVSVARR
jgi:PmbA protein